MKLWKKPQFSILIILFASLSLLVGSIAVPKTDTGAAIYANLRSSYPDSWLLLEPGLSSYEIRKRIGEPQADGRGLKLIDRWVRMENGIELHLDIFFSPPNEDEDAEAQQILIWKRALNRKTPLATISKGSR